LIGHFNPEYGLEEENVEMSKADLTRRALTLLAPALLLPASVLAAVAPTPGTTQGPFYPARLPMDNDADLVRVDGADWEAFGKILHLGGRVLDARGQALAGARVEIWQCDANGVYAHPGDRQFALRDPGFQGFGHAMTADNGHFAFRTIVPVPYPGRTPHIHVKVLRNGRKRLTTQLYLKGYRGNAIDFLFHSLAREERRRVEMALKPRGTPDGKSFETTIDLVLAV
jgi:protocatechuate 3,4-dioxygenase beta subunit